MTAIKARLDRTGSRVLSGVMGCGAELGLVLKAGQFTRDGWRPAVWLGPE